LKECIKCKTLKSSYRNFCEDCGEKLVETKKCPKCRDEIINNQRFCSNCGLDLNGPRIINITDDVEVVEKTDPIPIENQNPKPKPWYKKVFG